MRIGKAARRGQYQKRLAKAPFGFNPSPAKPAARKGQPVLGNNIPSQLATPTLAAVPACSPPAGTMPLALACQRQGTSAASREPSASAAKPCLAELG